MNEFVIKILFKNGKRKYFKIFCTCLSDAETKMLNFVKEKDFQMITVNLKQKKIKSKDIYSYVIYQEKSNSFKFSL